MMSIRPHHTGHTHMGKGKLSAFDFDISEKAVVSGTAGNFSLLKCNCGIRCRFDLFCRRRRKIFYYPFGNKIQFFSGGFLFSSAIKTAAAAGYDGEYKDGKKGEKNFFHKNLPFSCFSDTLIHDF